MRVREGTKARALKEAKTLLQRFGFNGFSFQHVADLLGIRKPSLYAHFNSKEDLGQELIEEYHSAFHTWTETISIFEPSEKIRALYEMFAKFSSQSGSFCPMSAMIADYHSLPKNLQKRLLKMFVFQKKWVSEVIQQGQRSRGFRSDLPAEDLAEVVLALGLGAQSIARISNDPKIIRSLSARALGVLQASSATRSAK